MCLRKLSEQGQNTSGPSQSGKQAHDHKHLIIQEKRHSGSSSNKPTGLHFDFSSLGCQRGQGGRSLGKKCDKVGAPSSFSLLRLCVHVCACVYVCMCARAVCMTACWIPASNQLDILRECHLAPILWGRSGFEHLQARLYASCPVFSMFAHTWVWEAPHWLVPNLGQL